MTEWDHEKYTNWFLPPLFFGERKLHPAWIGIEARAFNRPLQSVDMIVHLT